MGAAPVTVSIPAGAIETFYTQVFDPSSGPFTGVVYGIAIEDVDHFDKAAVDGAANDTSATATDLGAVVHVVGQDLTLPPADEDWFKLNARALAGTLDVVVSAQGDPVAVRVHKDTNADGVPDTVGRSTEVDLTLPVKDEDWYRVTAGTAGDLVTTVDSEPDGSLSVLAYRDADKDGLPDDLNDDGVPDPVGTATTSASRVRVVYSNAQVGDTFLVRVFGPAGQAEYNIDVRINQAPVANPDSYSVVEDSTLGTAMSSYTPNANYNGTDSFTYKANDGQSNSNIAQVTITVSAVNDAPAANAGPDQTVDEGTAVALVGTGADIDGDALSFTWGQISGPAVVLSSPNSPTTSFTAPQVDADALLVFQLTVSDGTLTASDTVNITARNVGIAFQPARTIGYWKNHTDRIGTMLSQGPIDLGDTTVRTVDQAVAVLSNADAKDARNALRAQLLGAILNLRNGANPSSTGVDIRPTIDAALTFLRTHNSPVDGKHPDRPQAIGLKDKLDAFNNSGE